MWTVKHCFVKSWFIYFNEIGMWVPKWRIPQKLYESFSQFIAGYAVCILLFLNMWSLWNLFDQISRVQLTSGSITREIDGFSFPYLEGHVGVAYMRLFHILPPY